MVLLRSFKKYCIAELPLEITNYKNIMSIHYIETLEEKTSIIFIFIMKMSTFGRSLTFTNLLLYLHGRFDVSHIDFYIGLI